MVDKFHCVSCGAQFDEQEVEQANHQCSDCGAELSGGQVDESTNKKGVLGTLIVVVVLLGLIGGGYLVWQSGGGKDNNSIKVEIEKILQQALEINGKTPMMIDQSTRLDQVVVEDKTIIYKTTLVNLSSEIAETDLSKRDLFKKQIGPFLAEKYCSDKNTGKALKLGVKYGHEYFGNDGGLLYTANVSVEDC